MRFELRPVLLLLAALLACSCSTTSFNTTWKSSDAVLDLTAGDSVVAMVVSPNESTRRGAEKALAAELDKRGLRGIPSYTVVPTKDVLDVDAARKEIETTGAKAVIVMRVISAEKEVSSTPGTISVAPYGRFYGGYYRRGWGAVYDPGYLRTDTIVSVETLVYELRTEELIWAGQSRTLNPDATDAFIAELVGEAAAEMKSQGVLLGGER